MNRGRAWDPAMRLYAHLSDVQKRAVRANGLPTTGLTPAQLDDLAECSAPTQAELMEYLKPGDRHLRRVGIYKGGVRLDKPQPGSTGPVMIRLTRQESQHYLCWVADVMGGPNAADLRAQSPELAWQQCQKEIPALADKQRSYEFGRDMGYSMLFALPDGTTKERPIELYAPVALGK